MTVARPIPPPPPVTSATLPVMRTPKNAKPAKRAKNAKSQLFFAVFAVFAFFAPCRSRHHRRAEDWSRDERGRAAQAWIILRRNRPDLDLRRRGGRQRAREERLAHGRLDEIPRRDDLAADVQPH